MRNCIIMTRWIFPQLSSTRGILYHRSKTHTVSATDARCEVGVGANTGRDGVDKSTYNKIARQTTSRIFTGTDAENFGGNMH